MKHRALIIDDDIDLGRLLVNCLSKENYQPVYVENGILGLEKMKEVKFDLVVLYIIFPQED
ncbi:MAG: hypothetical protein AB2421_17190 [Thermotaleaceae bacterium]